MKAITRDKSLTATAEIKGVRYSLAPQTIAVRKRINEFTTLENGLSSGRITEEEAVEKQISFVREISGCTVFDNIPIEEIDLTELECAVVAILNGYANVIRTEKLRGLMQTMPVGAKKKSGLFKK